MTYIFFSLLFSSVFFISTGAEASPYPAVSSSRTIAPKLGFYRAAAGFQLHAADSGWLQTAPPQANQTILTVYRDPKTDSKASLTVRVDRLAKSFSTETYVNHWIKEYPRFGFEVLGSQAFTQSGLRGHVIDIINRDTRMQLRQVVFVNQSRHRAAILTCRDQSSEFSQTLKSCNAITRTFQW